MYVRAHPRLLGSCLTSAAVCCCCICCKPGTDEGHSAERQRGLRAPQSCCPSPAAFLHYIWWKCTHLAGIFVHLHGDTHA